MLLLHSPLNISTNKNRLYEDGTVKLELNNSGEAILKITWPDGSKEDDIFLNTSKVDLRSRIITDDSFIAKVTSEDEDVEITLHGPHGNRFHQTTGDVVGCWQEVLAICDELFEDYIVRLNNSDDEVDWVLLAFHDKTVLVPSNTKDDRIIVLYGIGEVTEDQDAEKPCIMCTEYLDIKVLHSSKMTNDTTLAEESFFTTIKCTNETEHYALKHYLERLSNKDTSSTNFLSDYDHELSEHGQIEKAMILESREEVVYEKDLELFNCGRAGDTFFHKKLQAFGHGKLMAELGYRGYTSEESSMTSDTAIETLAQYPLPMVSFLYEWFWPHITYANAEKMLNGREESFVLIRMSQSKPGQFALTAAHGNIGEKKFKHFYIKTIGEGRYRLGKKRDIFTSFPEIIKYFVKIHDYKYIPFKTDRTEKWRSSMNCLTDIQRSRYYSNQTSDVNSASNAESVQSEIPTKPPRRRTKSKHRAPKATSMASVEMPMLLTIEDSSS